MKPKDRVKTTLKTDDYAGMVINRLYLAARANTTGTLLAPVPGHGGDIWFVQHDNSTEIGAYIVDELSVI